MKIFLFISKIGIVHIPQGMAYALMAGVPAINGLYVSFFTVILYVLLGTSRHLSTGINLPFYYTLYFMCFNAYVFRYLCYRLFNGYFVYKSI